jgi:CBS domain-containing protein
MSITPTKKPVETQRTSTALEAYRFLGDGKNAASLKQIRAALSFAYKHWDLKNPFAKIEPPLHKEPQIRRLPVLARDKRLVGIVSLGDLAIKDHENHAAATLERVSEPSRWAFLPR